MRGVRFRDVDVEVRRVEDKGRGLSTALSIFNRR